MEERGVVLLNGEPERLILERPDAEGLDAEGLGAAWLAHDALNARVRRVERGLGMAFLDAGPAAPGLTTPAAELVEGALVAARVVTPARRGKLAHARVLGTVEEAEPGRTQAPRSVSDRLRDSSPSAPIEMGPEAREAADAAEAEALQDEHVLQGGARLFIEPTRALIAVDVDVGASAAGGDPRRRQRHANIMALREIPRLLRLKGLGGIVAIDLVGKGHDGPALAAAALAAFQVVYGPDVALGPISRFGVLQLQLPWLDTPTAELLRGADGEPSPLTCAFALLRAIEREVGPGGRVEARCSPEVHAAAAPGIARLSGLIGARFTVTPDSAVASARPMVTPT